MEQAIAQSRSNSDQLARDISAAVMAMQFQDSVTQRIGHVVRTLEELHGALQSRLGTENAMPGSEPNDWTDRMAGRYTMLAERRVLATHHDPETSATSDLGGNVGLF